MFDWLFRREKKKKIGPDPRHYTQGGMWGRNISFPRGWKRDQIQQRVAGHWSPKPRKGDLLFVEMQSGKTAVCIFDEVEHCGDPPDMFFGYVSTLGYTDELEIYPLI